MIYLDNAATTKPKPEVIETINYALCEQWGNPSSLYKFGQSARVIVDEARKTVANFIGVKPSEIIFTSGACESNSMAILGLLLRDFTSEFITSSIEHKSIHNLQEAWGCYDPISVNSEGYIEFTELEKILKTLYKRNKTSVVSIQYANSEIGTIQNIKEISKIVHKYGGIFHTDATQMIANSPVNVKDLNIDMMSFSGQKIGAPKGIGVLYVKNGIELEPIIYGSQEGGRRGGTENVPYIVGLSAAIKSIQYPTYEIRDYFWEKLSDQVRDIYVIGSMEHRLNNNLAVCFKGVEAESLQILLDEKGVCVSAGSACMSGKKSYVLENIGMPIEDQSSVIRFTFGVDTTKKEIDAVIKIISDGIDLLRGLNSDL